MQIWIDGDACPKIIKDLLFRASMRTHTYLIVVSNHPLSVPASPYIKKWQVGAGFDVVDQYIVEHVKLDDLVITADIPFVDAVVSKGAFALNPRGELYSSLNIKLHLAMRNLNESLRSCNLIRGGPEKISPKEIQIFANALDRFLAQHKKKNR